MKSGFLGNLTRYTGTIGVLSVAIASATATTPETPDLYLVSCETKSILRVTNNDRYESRPNWHPSLNKFTYSSTSHVKSQLSPFNLYTDNARALKPVLSQLHIYDCNTNMDETLKTDTSLAFEPDFSPDGNQIAFASLTDYGLRPMILNLITNEQYALPLMDEELHHIHSPQWSADGSLILCAVTAQMGLSRDIVVYDLAGKNVKKINATDIRQDEVLELGPPTWTSDGAISALMKPRDSVDSSPTPFEFIELQLDKQESRITSFKNNGYALDKNQFAQVIKGEHSELAVLATAGSAEPTRIEGIRIEDVEILPEHTSSIVTLCESQHDLPVPVYCTSYNQSLRTAAVVALPESARPWASNISADVELFRRMALIEQSYRGSFTIGVFGQLLFSASQSSPDKKGDAYLLENGTALQVVTSNEKGKITTIAQWVGEEPLEIMENISSQITTLLPTNNPFLQDDGTVDVARHDVILFQNGQRLSQEPSAENWLFVSAKGGLFHLSICTSRPEHYIAVRYSSEPKILLVYAGPKWNGTLASLTRSGVTFEQVLFPRGLSVPAVDFLPVDILEIVNSDRILEEQRGTSDCVPAPVLFSLRTK